MSKLLILILYSTFLLFSCEKQKPGGNGNKNASPTPAPTARDEKNAQTSPNTAVNQSNAPRFGSVSAAGDDKFWAVIEDQDGKLISTEDSGATWQTIREKGIAGISFTDKNRGWLNDRDGQIFSTVDGGKTWSKTLPDGVMTTVRKIEFADSLNGWYMDATGVFQSSDGGKSWTATLEYGRNLRGQPSGWFFLDNRTGWVCDGGDVSGNLYRTLDAGATWSSKKVGKNNSSPCRLFFVSSSEGFYSLQKQFFQTHDGGENWSAVTTLPANFEIRSMFWRDAANGWLAGYFETKPRQPQGGKGALLRTADGGKTWTATNPGENNPFFTEIIFTDPQNGWLVARDNIYKTSNGSEEWNLVYSLPPVKLPPSE